MVHAIVLDAGLTHPVRYKRHGRQTATVTAVADDDGVGENRRLLRELEERVRQAERTIDHFSAIVDRHTFLRDAGGQRLLDDLSVVLSELHEAGVTQLLTPAESIPLEIENLPSLVEERGGVAALRRSLRLAIRVIREQLARRDLQPWWGPVLPDFVIVAAETTTTALFDRFASHLVDDLEVLRNRPTLAVSSSEVDDEHPLPVEAFGVVSNDGEALRWAERNGLWAIRCEERQGGLLVTPQWEPEKQLDFVNPAEAALAVADLLESAGTTNKELPDSFAGSARDCFEITVEEHRRLEVVLLAAVKQMDAVELDPEDRELLQTAIDTLQLQLRTSKPDRTIIGRTLRRLGAAALILAGGVAGNYLTDLLRRFPVPWP